MINAGTRIERSIIGIRSRVGRNAHLKDVVMIGADRYERSDGAPCPLGGTKVLVALTIHFARQVSHHPGQVAASASLTMLIYSHLPSLISLRSTNESAIVEIASWFWRTRLYALT